MNDKKLTFYQTRYAKSQPQHAVDFGPYQLRVSDEDLETPDLH